MTNGLIPGEVYTIEELGARFGIKPAAFTLQGGMVPAKAKRALLLTTNVEHDSSFDYGDRWDGPALVYTGRGQKGDQTLAGYNQQVADNSRMLLLFQRIGSNERRYVGKVVCRRYWWDVQTDKRGHQRKVLQFRLELDVV
jgi:hypothetical protein